jgi:hypothetical protein
MPGQWNVCLHAATRPTNPPLEATFTPEPDALIERERAVIAFLSDELDPQNVGMLVCDDIEQLNKELAADPSPLSVRMNRYCQIAKDVGKGVQLASVRMELTGQPG